jgi:hypothetical protein
MRLGETEVDYYQLGASGVAGADHQDDGDQDGAGQ